WKNQLTDRIEQTGGRYAWHPDGGFIRADRSFELRHTDHIELSICHAGHWNKDFVPVSTASFLYSRRRDTERDAYIVSVLSPCENPRTFIMQGANLDSDNAALR